MRGSRNLLILVCGLFSIAAQTLLFREFLTTFEGGDISVGIFFGTWFLWVGIGARLVRRESPVGNWLQNNIEVLLLGYVPAFVLALLLIAQARPLAGVDAFALLSVSNIVLLSAVVNAPVSLITGLLFPVACRWFQRDGGGAVARVYRMEVAGSFFGGIGTTLLLAAGASPMWIFFILALLVSLAALAVRLAKPRGWTWAVVPLALLICLLAGVDGRLTARQQSAKWARLLPRESFRGAFQTPQAEYLHGVYQDQWVALRDGATCEVLPDTSGSGRTAGTALCQNPGARSILVIGSGLGLCYRLLTLPQIEQVTRAHSDGAYVRTVERYIPPQFKVDDDRLQRYGGDIRTRLAAMTNQFDLVLLNLPDAASAVLNRYYTVEGYRRMRDALRPGGVLAVRIAGGANRMGPEQVNLGASAWRTLLQVFPRLVLVPGEETWLIVSVTGSLSGDPGTLRDRLAAVPGGRGLYPPEALLSTYLPDRAAAALDLYARADLPERLMINRDARPLAHLYGLLLAAKQAGAPGMLFMKRLAVSGIFVFVVPILVFAMLRLILVRQRDLAGGAAGHDGSLLVFSSGWVGIGIMIVLMYVYQTVYGSLYLHIGIVSALSMAGLTAGASLMARQANRLPHRRIEIGVLLAHAAILIAIACWPVHRWTHAGFTVAFLLCGLCAGCYFPLAASRLAGAGLETGEAAGRLETADHIGAAAGGLLTGLILVPTLGPRAALLVLALLLLTNLPPVLARGPEPEGVRLPATVTARLRRIGIILACIALTVLLCARLLSRYTTADEPSRPRPAAPPPRLQSSAGLPADIERMEPDSPGDGRPRTVDLQHVRTLIQQGRLSDKEALFYELVDPP